MKPHIFRSVGAWNMRYDDGKQVAIVTDNSEIPAWPVFKVICAQENLGGLMLAGEGENA